MPLFSLGLSVLYTKKGTNIKEEAVTISVAAGVAQRSGAERNDPLAASVAWRTASWPGGCFNGSAAVSTGSSELPRRLEPSRRFWTGRFGVLTRRRRSRVRRRLSKPGRSL